VGSRTQCSRIGLRNNRGEDLAGGRRFAVDDCGGFRIHGSGGGQRCHNNRGDGGENLADMAKRFQERCKVQMVLSGW